MKSRHLLLGTVFAITLAASVFDLPWQHGNGADAQSEASAAAHGRRSADASMAHAPAAAQERVAPSTPAAARMVHTKANAFSVHRWLPPPVKRPPPPPPPPPRAPALPFTYLGKMQDGGDVTAFVSQGSRNLVLHAGDTLPGYKVESISLTDMIFVYLPLNEKQRLTFGSAN